MRSAARAGLAGHRGGNGGSLGPGGSIGAPHDVSRGCYRAQQLREESGPGKVRLLVSCSLGEGA